MQYGSSTSPKILRNKSYKNQMHVESGQRQTRRREAIRKKNKNKKKKKKKQKKKRIIRRIKRRKEKKRLEELEEFVEEEETLEELEELKKDKDKKTKKKEEEISGTSWINYINNLTNCLLRKPPLVPTFSKILPISRITTHLPQIHFNIILPSTSWPP